MERHVLEKIPSPNLRAYVVWLPVLRAGNVEAAAHRETRRVADQRASHLFDSDARLGKRYGPIIHLPEGVPAWDVYFVFGPSARWEDRPPAPTYWMHQLGRAAPAELRLNGEQLARVVNGLLGANGKVSQRYGSDSSFSAISSRPLASLLPVLGSLALPHKPDVFPRARFLRYGPTLILWIAILYWPVRLRLLRALER